MYGCHIRYVYCPPAILCHAAADGSTGCVLVVVRVVRCHSVSDRAYSCRNDDSRDPVNCTASCVSSPTS